MRMRSLFAAVMSLGLLLPSLSVTPTVASTKAPLGYLLMCLQQPQECEGGGASMITATDSLLQTLKAVNGRVNRQIRPVADGRVDDWQADVTRGDCEDYVLTKRRALLRQGLPSSALRIAYVKTRWGEGHAILVVRTSIGDLVLDNINPALRPLSRSGYRMVAMSGADPLKWS